MRDMNSGYYMRGIFFLFITIVLVAVIGYVTVEYVLDRNQEYVWESDSGLLPAASRPQNYPLTEKGESPFVSVVEKTRNAVVFIYAEGENPRAQNIDPMWRRFLGIPPRVASYGSGFIIRPDGYIITNNHVIEGGDRIMVSLSDERSFRAELIGGDPQTDLAVLKIDVPDSLPFIPMGDSDDMRIGDWVIAIGNPFPEQGLDRTVTVGVISAKSRRDLRFGSDTPAYQDYIQTDASINPGNSGGPLVNLAGEVIGINSAIASPSRGSVGIGFAIPSNLARSIISSLIEEGRVSRGWLGVTLQELSPDQAEASGLPEGITGVLITGVLNESPADRGGLLANDIILEFGGKATPDVYTLRLLVAEKRQGEKVDVKISRDGRVRDLGIVLGDRDQSLASADDQRNWQYTEPRGDDDSSGDNWFGMKVETANSDLASRFNVEYHPGVLVTEIIPGSPADKKNVSPGTIITKVDFKDVRTKEEFYEIADKLKEREKAVAFYIFDLNGNIGYIALKSES